MKSKGNVIRGVIRYKSIVYLILFLLIAIGAVGLFRMNKDEFPTFEIKQGLVVGVYPGAGAKDVETQLTKPLEDILFSFSEVDRKATYSYSKDGICFIYVDLTVSAKRKDEVWSKIKLKLDASRAKLPAGVLAVAVLDEFSSVSALLIALESDDKSYREMEEYAEDLSDRLKEVPQVSNVSIVGTQSEEIAVNIDRDRLSAYGISPTSLMLNYQSGGIQLLSGTFKSGGTRTPVHFSHNLTTEEEIARQIIYADPSGAAVRLQDVATVERRYKEPTSLVKYNGHSALILSVEMRPDNNIVAFGKDIDKVLASFAEELPESVSMSRITDQPKVVGDSVYSFLRDLLISMAVVIFVMLMLFPMRSALIASSGVPVCTAVTIAIMFVTGMYLNTVTLAALIVVLGMIVDDSIITMDGYMDKLGKGMERTDAAVASARELFMPMLMATAGIGLMFFPAAGCISGYLGEFAAFFPPVVAIALGISLVYAMMVVPSMEVKFIKSARPSRRGLTARFQKVLFDALQKGYEWLEALCFRHPRLTLLSGFGVIVLGVFFFTRIHIQMMPFAARDYFAIEVYLENNAGLAQTESVTDSIQNALLKDKRVKSVTSFIGTGAPRFTAVYVPMVPGINTAQLVVTTQSCAATEQLLSEYGTRFEHAFPGALVRFKQMSYQAAVAPVAVEFTGTDIETMKPYADRLRVFMQQEMDNTLQWVHSDCDGYVNSVRVDLDADEASRLGVNRALLSLSLAGALGAQPLASVWEDGRSVPVNLYGDFGWNTTSSAAAGSIQTPADFDRLNNQIVATMLPGVSVPLRQVAELSPAWELENYPRKAGKEMITVSADLQFGCSHPAAMKEIKKYVEEELKPALPSEIKVQYGGLSSMNDQVIPEIVLAFICAVAVLFFSMLFHFKKISLALLTLSLCLLCLFGAFFGLWVMGLDFGLTAVLGLISLVGIIVRNGIIMFEYADELRTVNGYDVKTAAFEAGKRRMRPIFLTSCTTALGVLPMVLRADPLWKPMGVVISFGTILSIVLIVTIMPVSYWQIFRHGTRYKVQGTKGGEREA